MPRNLFSIGRERGAEDQLTEMLVWLAEAVPAVRGAIVSLALGHSDADPGEIEVATQHGIVDGRLDAYLTGPGFALVVESKLRSDYGADQLRRYASWLSSGAVAQRQRALMTLTEREAPWPPDDVAYAAQRQIRGGARRWQDLHRALEPVAEDPGMDPLAARLVRDFLEMLSEEGLIPVQPLTTTELGPARAAAWTLVRRYREFFHACKTRIAKLSGADALSNSWSDRGDWFWQDYRFEDGVRLVIGLLATDEFERLPAGTHTRAPIVFLGVKADHLPRWEEAAAWLDAHPPEGWRAGNRWQSRPTAWRYLAEVVGDGTFEEQRERLAAAATAARPWLEEAESAVAHSDR